MDIESNYEISPTVDFIRSRNFTRVALQFPDELLKDSTKVVTALRDKLHYSESNESHKNIGLYVMADTTYGSCCVDEVGASHINADCVIHYGHTCLSPTSTLPAFFVFGRAPISVSNCTEKLTNYASTSDKPAVILFGLEYAHAIDEIRETWAFQSSTYHESTTKSKPCFAKITCSIMDPSEKCKASQARLESNASLDANGCADDLTRTYSIGGLTWRLPEGHNVEEYMLYWIGADNAAFANLVLTFNGCEIVRYDPAENCLVTDVSQQRRILKRRYYLVEKAKDANIVGILVGTLGVAGYLHMINQMKELITRAGKKAYTLVMGRPNPAKLANFPECDVFIYVSCAQTTLLDSKEFLAPVITPYEAMLAFSRGSQWTGAYVMEFQNLITSFPVAEARDQVREGRFSFLQGGYVEDLDLEESNEKDEYVSSALVKATEKALQVRDSPQSVIRGTSAKSGAEFLAARSYQGLENRSKSSLPEPYFVGKSGKASGYEGEEGKKK